MANSAHPASLEARREVVLGVVGGSGLYQMDALHGAERVELETPFGAPSGPFMVGQLPRAEGPPVKAVFVPRHGPGHRLLPGEINYRANVHGLKQLGVTHMLSVSAVGSLREAIVPGHVVFVDQLIDRTKGRATTFFGDGVVGHVQFGEPTDPRLRALGIEAAKRAGATVHEQGTLVVMEGPAFSTRAESELYRAWGAHVIGMTALPEAKLAREAEIAWSIMALSTDYDCWHDEEVSVEAVMATVEANVAVAQRTIIELAGSLPVTTRELPYPRACDGAVMTAFDAMPPETRTRLDLIIGHYL
jgi:5'-methylthioadenosine phosphorylase